MQLVKPTTSKRINSLRHQSTALGIAIIIFFSMLSSIPLQAQDNSPYSRYGIGDLVPNTNINSRAMGGVSAAMVDHLSINLNNPAAYSYFQSFKEAKTKKLSSARALLDIGMNMDYRGLHSNSTDEKFTAKNLLFSHVQIGMPLRKNWGISFGLKPISRISYSIGVDEMLKDPNTGNPIDSAFTEYAGDGGTSLASFGTGFRLLTTKKAGVETGAISLGLNAGYLFGKKKYNTRRSFYNDSIPYNWGNYESNTTYGNIYFNAGLLYRTVLNQKKATSLTIGAYGNWQQQLKAKQDIKRETFVYDESLGDVQLDSVYEQKNIAGTLEYPASFTIGFAYERFPIIEKDRQQSGFLISVDFTSRNWEQYRFYNKPDLVANTWELRAGAELRPVPRRNFFSNVMYRFGFFTGPDYIFIAPTQLHQMGFTAGLGLPIGSNAVARQGQISLLNIALEYIKRGNKDNIVNENMFRISVGLSFSDLWFIKRKYD